MEVFCNNHVPRRNDQGSTELLVVGLIAALVIVLCIPLLSDVGSSTEDNLGELSDGMLSEEPEFGI